MASEIVRLMLGEGVTTHLSNTDEANRIAKKVWGPDQISLVDPYGTTSAYHEFRVVLNGGGTGFLRQYKQGRWFYVDQRTKTWTHVAAF